MKKFFRLVSENMYKPNFKRVIEEDIMKPRRKLEIDSDFAPDYAPWKGRLVKVYDGFAIYRDIVDDESYCFVNDKMIIFSESINNNDLYDILDMIDNYNETEKFGADAFLYDEKLQGKSVYRIHPNGYNRI